MTFAPFKDYKIGAVLRIALSSPLLKTLL